MLTPFWREVLGLEAAQPGYRIVTDRYAFHYHLGPEPVSGASSAALRRLRPSLRRPGPARRAAVRHAPERDAGAARVRSAVAGLGGLAVVGVAAQSTGSATT